MHLMLHYRKIVCYKTINNTRVNDMLGGCLLQLIFGLITTMPPPHNALKLCMYDKTKEHYLKNEGTCSE